MQWLKDHFLAYLCEWENSVKSRKTYTPAQRNKMLLSRQTREGLKITGMSCIGVHCMQDNQRNLSRLLNYPMFYLESLELSIY